jgi:predicted thioesterase
VSAMGLAPGAERTEEFEVGGRLLTDVGGTIGVAVLSTPGMIGMMERTAAMLARRSPRLPSEPARLSHRSGG